METTRETNWLTDYLGVALRTADQTVVPWGGKLYRLNSPDLPRKAGLAYLRLLVREMKAEG